MTGAISGVIFHESLLLGISFVQGILLMFTYDLLRILRKVIPHSNVLVSIEDVIYWVMCGLSVFVMLYEENDGTVRWFVLAGVSLGMLLWNLLVSPWVVRLLTAFIRKMLHLIQKILNPMVRPAKKIFHKIGRIKILWKKQLKKIGKAIKIGLCKH